MQKSNEVARSMAQLMKVGQFQSVSAEFSKELIKVLCATTKNIENFSAFSSLRWVLWAK